MSRALILLGKECYFLRKTGDGTPATAFLSGDSRNNFLLYDFFLEKNYKPNIIQTGWYFIITVKERWVKKAKIQGGK